MVFVESGDDVALDVTTFRLVVDRLPGKFDDRRFHGRSSGGGMNRTTTPFVIGVGALARQYDILERLRPAVGDRIERRLGFFSNACGFASHGSVPATAGNITVRC